jgi:hypothetical protein
MYNIIISGIMNLEMCSHSKSQNKEISLDKVEFDQVKDFEI